MKFLTAGCAAVFSLGLISHSFGSTMDDFQEKPAEREQGRSTADIVAGQGQVATPLSLPTGRYEGNKPVSQGMESGEAMGAVIQPQYFAQDGSINRKDNPDAKGMGTGSVKQQDGSFNVILHNAPWQALDQKVKDSVVAKLESSTNPNDAKQLEAIKAGGANVFVNVDNINVKKGADQKTEVAMNGRTTVIVKGPSPTSQPATQIAQAAPATNQTASPAAQTQIQSQAQTPAAAATTIAPSIIQAVNKILPSGMAAPIVAFLNTVIAKSEPTNARPAGTLLTTVAAVNPNHVVMISEYAPLVFKGVQGNLTAGNAAKSGIVVTQGIDSYHFNITAPMNQLTPMAQKSVSEKLVSAPTYDAQSNTLAAQIKTDPNTRVSFTIDIHTYVNQDAVVAANSVRPAPTYQDPMLAMR